MLEGDETEKFGVYIAMNYTLVLLWIATAILCGSLIYYEKNVNDRYRTLLNKLHTMMLICIMTSFTVLDLITLARFWAGPLALPVCYLASLTPNFMLCFICLTLIESALLNWIYQRHPSGVGAIREDVFLAFIAVSNPLMSLFLSSFFFFGNMVDSDVISRCSGRSMRKVFSPTVVDIPILQCGFMWISVAVF